jgi:hypothetical protein
MHLATRTRTADSRTYRDLGSGRSRWVLVGAQPIAVREVGRRVDVAHDVALDELERGTLGAEQRAPRRRP